MTPEKKRFWRKEWGGGIISKYGKKGEKCGGAHLFELNLRAQSIRIVILSIVSYYKDIFPRILKWKIIILKPVLLGLLNRTGLNFLIFISIFVEIGCALSAVIFFFAWNVDAVTFKKVIKW